MPIILVVLLTIFLFMLYFDNRHFDYDTDGEGSLCLFEVALSSPLLLYHVMGDSHRR